MAPVLFALGATRAFGERVARVLGVPLAAHEERDFEDGEHKVRPLESVRDRDVYLLHALYGEPGQSANDKLMRLLILAGAVRDAGAARVSAVVPYLCYARKDRRTKAWDPVSSRYVAQMIEAVGITRVLTLDVHNPAAFENAFRVNATALEAAPLFVAALAARLQGTDVVVVTPDAGGAKRAERLRARFEHTLGRPVGAAFMEKHRSEGVVSGALFAGDVAGKVAVIVDDLVATGTTLARAVEACRSRGACTVYAAATHGLFTAGADDVLAAMPIEKLLVTDCVPPFRLPAPAPTKLEIVDTAELFAGAIHAMHTGGSLTRLQDPAD